MASEKMMYWGALAVLTVAFGHSFITRHANLNECYTRRAMAIFQRMTGEAEGYVNLAQAQLNAHSVRVRPEIAAIQLDAGLARMQAAAARQQVALARIQCQGEQWTQMRNLRIETFNDMKNLRIEVPQTVHVHSAGTI